MKHDWEYKKLGEVASYINGYAFKPEEWTDKGLPIIRIQNLNNEGAIYNYFNGDIPAKYVVEDGDLLISWSASLGAYIWQGEKAYLNQHIFKVVFDKSDISKYYLKLVVESKLAEMGKSTHGATMKHITKKDFDNVPIPVPPLPTQQSIVSELDSLSKIIADCKETLKDYDALEQSIFYDMFGDPVKNDKGWDVKKLGEVASIKTGPFGSLLHKHDYISGGIPLVNPIHMRNFQIEPSYDLTITEEKANELKEYVLKENDVVLARRGDIGRCAIVSKKENGYLCGTGSLFIRFKESISPVFTMYVVKSDSFVKHLQQCSKGATMLNLNTTTVSNLQIIIPPLPLQQQFASKIEAIEKMKSETKKALQEAETLFNARMDYWFN